MNILFNLFKLNFINKFVLFLVFNLQVTSATNNKDYVADLIKKCDYPVEIHRNIQTEDGYLLTMQRIPRSRNIKEHIRNNGNATKTPVLLMHGALGSAENFLLLGCEKSLAYLLSDQGYDVWLGNVRSVSYSRHHVSLDPNSWAYWQFTYDELGSYDLAALIDYILKVANETSLMFIGHSQGNTLLYIMCSNNPEHADKVQLFINLSPIASLKDFPHPWLKEVGKNLDRLQAFTDQYGLYELTMGRDFVREYGSIICGGILNDVCKFIIYFMTGMSPSNIHNSDLQRMLINFPEGTGVKQLYHAFQMLNARTLQKYDFGSSELNVEHYGVERPPKYNVSLTKCPKALYYTKSDWFVSHEAVKELEMLLPNIVDSYLIPIDDFSHADFILGWNAPRILYPRIISLMNSMNKKLP